MQTQPHIEFLNVTANHYPKGEPAFTLRLHPQHNVFWASGAIFFDTPQKFVRNRTGRLAQTPQVNLWRFECTAQPNLLTGVSLLDLEISENRASDSIAYDLLHFMNAYKRNPPINGDGLKVFTLVYNVSSHVTRTEDGKDHHIEITCLGELDYQRIGEICNRGVPA